MRRKLGIAVLAAVAVTGLIGIQPAHANTTGCVTYLEYVWQADYSATINGGQASAATTAANATDTNNACIYVNGYATETSSTQFYWTIYGWLQCDQDPSTYPPITVGVTTAFTTCNDGSGYIGSVGNRQISGHRAWFAGNPWDHGQILDG